MLDRAKLIQELNALADSLFFDSAPMHKAIAALWDKCAQDTFLATRIQAIALAQQLPTWTGILAPTYPVVRHVSDYTVLAVDGSQIYSDRHQAVACYLINIGTVRLTYGKEQSSSAIACQPFVFQVQETDGDSVDVVNCQREAYELRIGFNQSRACDLVLFDGSLIFWHLQSKPEAIKERFLAEYIDQLEQFHIQKIPMASYISAPKSKELIQALCMYTHTELPTAVDAHIASYFLPQGHRSLVFKNNSVITHSYPEHVRPHFVYIKTMREIVRVEFPAWVVADSDVLERSLGIILDQIEKGSGYPICLAEAHEAAVVKGADREFFYHLLQKIGIDQGRRYYMSQKQVKKRGIGI